MAVARARAGHVPEVLVFAPALLAMPFGSDSDPCRESVRGFSSPCATPMFVSAMFGNGVPSRPVRTGPPRSTTWGAEVTVQRRPGEGSSLLKSQSLESALGVTSHDVQPCYCSPSDTTSPPY